MTTPEPSPATELRTAAATLRRLANAALMDVLTNPYWNSEFVPADQPDARYTHGMRGGMGGAAGDLGAMFTPDAVTLLAEWLDAVADEMTAVDGTEYAYEEYPSWMAAVATARAINGTTVPADPDHGAPAGAGVCDRCRQWDAQPDRHTGCPQCGQPWDRRTPAVPEETTR